MVIGILTYYNVCNFGANLQALSTYSFLKNNGHYPIFIKYFPKRLEEFYKNNTVEEQRKVHEDFVKDFTQTERCFSSLDVANVIKAHHMDAVVIGSDAVLQHHPLLSRIVFPSSKIISISKCYDDSMFPNPFWGDFNNYLDSQVPMALISASSQNSEYSLFSHDTKEKMKDALNKFSYISVRDDWTCKMVKKITANAIAPEITPDPVFSFNSNVDHSIQISEEEIRHKFGIGGKYILLSFHPSMEPDESWMNDFDRLCRSKNLTCLGLPFPQKTGIKSGAIRNINLPLSPLEWYGLLKYSSGYVGNNMHPIVVCLHNGVPCYSFDNYGVLHLRLFVNKGSSKIYHILNEFGLSDNRSSCLSRMAKRPSPEDIISKLELCDRGRIVKKAGVMQQRYNNMMNTVLKSIVGK